MSNHIAKNQTVIDTKATDVDAKDSKDDKNFFERHPVFCRRAKKALKIVGGVLTIVGGVYAGQKIADSNRTYYIIDLDARADGTYHISDVNPDLIEKDKDMAVNNTTIEYET